MKNKKEKGGFKFKLGLRSSDKKRIVEDALNSGLLEYEEIETIIKESKNFIKNRKKCYVCGEKESLKLCSNCKNYFYCSREHQREDWKEHKKTCKFYRYALEDRILYLQHSKASTKPDYFPTSKLEKKKIDNALDWGDYFFELRKKFFVPIINKLEKKYNSPKNELRIQRSQFSEYPELRIATGKLSFSLSLYYALQQFKTSVRNKVISIVIHYIGPNNVDVLESVKEFCMLMYNCKTVGITFIGENLPSKDEISEVTFDTLTNCAIYFWKKKYDVREMLSMDKENLVVLYKGILFDRLFPLYDLLLHERNVLILFHSEKYYNITMKLLNILKVNIVSSGKNPFSSYEFCDPCKKIKENEFFAENQYFICCNTNEVNEKEEKLIEGRFRDYLSIITKKTKMEVEDIYLYMVGVNWGFAKKIDMK